MLSTRSTTRSHSRPNRIAVSWDEESGGSRAPRHDEGKVVMRSLRPQRLSLPGVAAALGGYLVLAGCLLPWLDTGGVNVGSEVVSGTPAGMETAAGPVALVSGIVVLIAATLMFLVRRVSNVWALLVLLAGAVGAVAAILTLADPRDAYLNFVASELGRNVSEIENSLNALFDIGGIRAALGFGVYVSLAGGGLSILAGTAELVARRRRRARVPPRAADDVAPPTEIQSEVREAEQGPGEEKADTEMPKAAEPAKSDLPPVLASAEPDEQPAPAPEPTRKESPPPSDVDEWR